MSLLDVICFSSIFLLQSRNELDLSREAVTGPYMCLFVGPRLLLASFPSHFGHLRVWLHRLICCYLRLKLVHAASGEMPFLAEGNVDSRFCDREVVVMSETQKQGDLARQEALGFKS
jgi:hypothetical protein